MRIALLSDIHGNAFALDAVLKDARDQKVDQFVCLGDVLPFGPQPLECLQLVRELGCPVVMGNADEWLLGDVPGDVEKETRTSERRPNHDRLLWCYEQLGQDEFAVIRAYQPTVTVGNATLLCFHGSPRSNTEVIVATTPDDDLTPMFAGHDALIGAGGHTHAQMLRRWRDWLIINPGSIGLPFVKKVDGTVWRPPFAEYAIIEANAGALSIDLCRVALDVPAMLHMAASSGMPHSDAWIAEWL